MDRIAFQYISLSQPEIMGINFLLVIAGGIIGGLTWRQSAPMRRVAYFLSYAGMFFTYSLVQASWAEAPRAIVGGYLGTMFLVSLIATVAMGYGVWIIAAARSQDISGDQSKALLAFVPLVNLYLFFAARKEDLGGVPQGAPRSKLGCWLWDPLLVIAGIGLLAMGNGITQAMEYRAARGPGPAENAVLQERVNDVMGPAGFMKMVAAEMSRGLPVRVDEITRLVDVRAEGSVLTFDYRVDTNGTRLNQAFSDDLVRKACLPENLGSALRAGGTLIHHYERNDGYVILHLVIRSADCS